MPGESGNGYCRFHQFQDRPTIRESLHTLSYHFPGHGVQDFSIIAVGNDSQRYNVLRVKDAGRRQRRALSGYQGARPVSHHYQPFAVYCDHRIDLRDHELTAETFAPLPVGPGVYVVLDPRPMLDSLPADLRRDAGEAGILQALQKLMLTYGARFAGDHLSLELALPLNTPNVSSR